MKKGQKPIFGLCPFLISAVFKAWISADFTAG
jgi:hypothetical protein